MDQQPQNRQLQPRKKIWEIEGCYKCALIGTCLSRSELRTLARERVFALEPGGDDYQLHGRFIGFSAEDAPRGRALDTFLEKKYRSAAKKYRHRHTDPELKALWEEDLAAGRVDSAWWAIMTHPQASTALVANLYGLLHMLSHDGVNCHHRDCALRTQLRTKVAMLEEVLASERQHHRREHRHTKEELAALKQEAATRPALIRENQALASEIAALKAHLLDLSNQRQQQPEQRLIAELRQENNTLYGRIDELGRELQGLQAQHLAAAIKLETLAALRYRLARHEADQAGEVAQLEGLVFQQIAKKKLCRDCADHNSDNCPGPNLCGKTVLYGGGLHKMVPHYRQLVENYGGRFLHHDGGREATRNLLPKMLSTADAVFCPVDCVSHDACICVKKMCKRYQKPFVLMRSAGLSSLAKGLGGIVQ